MLKRILCAARENSNVELEARFGIVDANGRFVAGVSRGVMDEIMSFLQESPHIKCDEEWHEEQDFFFALGSETLRTRVNYDSNHMKLNVATIRRVQIGNVLFPSRSTDDASWQVRIAAKEEVPCEAPSSCQTTCVRIKQRRRFMCLRHDHSPPAFAFDFSMTWTGKTKTAAEKAQTTIEPVYEIECELISREYLMNHDDEYVVESMLMKMGDLVDDDFHTGALP